MKLTLRALCSAFGKLVAKAPAPASTLEIERRVSIGAMIEQAKVAATPELATAPPTPDLVSSASSSATSLRLATPDGVTANVVREVGGGFVIHPAFTVIHRVQAGDGDEQHLILDRKVNPVKPSSGFVIHSGYSLARVVKVGADVQIHIVARNLDPAPVITVTPPARAPTSREAPPPVRRPKTLTRSLRVRKNRPRPLITKLPPWANNPVKTGEFDLPSLIAKLPPALKSQVSNNVTFADNTTNAPETTKTETETEIETETVTASAELTSPSRSSPAETPSLLPQDAVPATTAGTKAGVTPSPSLKDAVPAIAIGPKMDVNTPFSVPPTSAAFISRIPDIRVFMAHVAGKIPSSVYELYFNNSVQSLALVDKGRARRPAPTLDNVFPLLGEEYASAQRLASAVGRLHILERAVDHARHLEKTATATVSSWHGPDDCKAIMRKRIDTYGIDKRHEILSLIEECHRDIRAVLDELRRIDPGLSASTLHRATVEAAKSRSLINIGALLASVCDGPFSIGAAEFAITCPAEGRIIYPGTDSVFSYSIIGGQWFGVVE